MKLGACPKLLSGPENRVWFRALEPQFATAPLASAHTTANPSRFSPGPLGIVPFEILYFSENQMIALFEMEALLGSPKKGTVIADPRKTWLTINVQIVLQQVVDLTHMTAQKLLGTSAQELTGDWQGYQTRGSATSVKEPVGFAPTQDLGEALSSLGFEGFRTVSAKVPQQMNLVVFPENLLKGSQLVYPDPVSGKTHRVKGKL
jgi:RES domain-containing protein